MLERKGFICLGKQKALIRNNYYIVTLNNILWKMIDIAQLKELIASKLIKDQDLSHLELNGIDFSGCNLENVVFANELQENRELKNITFAGAKLDNVFFDHATLGGCNFDGDKTTLTRVSFKKSILYKCRFRKTQFLWCDFRYAEINSATFESAIFSWCDFYRTFFVGIVIFRKALVGNSSLFYTYFDEGATLRRENLRDSKILQQDKNAYREFLVDWPKLGPGIRKNEQGVESDWDPTASLRARFMDAEDIYKTLNGLWTSKGFLGDANWAFVKGKKMERKRMINELFYGKDLPISKVVNLTLLSFWNFVTDKLFGYGESMSKMILTYIVTIFIFAYIYYSSSVTNLPDYLKALIISLKNMVAQTSDEVSGISPFLDFLNMVQTTIGILITGIFGFILGNKIRNQ
jgi:uncharacterized protein YjbI with pentapeptide repeats